MQRTIGNKAIVEAEETKTIFRKLREEDRDRPLLENTNFDENNGANINRNEKDVSLQGSNYGNPAQDFDRPKIDNKPLDETAQRRSWLSVFKLWRA